MCCKIDIRSWSKENLVGTGIQFFENFDNVSKNALRTGRFTSMTNKKPWISVCT